MHEARDFGKQIAEGLAFLDIISERDFRGCLRLPATLYPEYVPDPEIDYKRGMVLRMPGDKVSKYAFTGDGRIQNGNPPPINSLLKLVRNLAGRYRWVREEFCEKGMWRWWDNDPNRPEQHGWYEVIADIVDDATEPPNATNRWEFKGSDNPPG